MLTKEEKDSLTAKIIEYLECEKDISDILLNTPEGQKLYAEIYAELTTKDLAEVKQLDDLSDNDWEIDWTKNWEE